MEKQEILQLVHRIAAGVHAVVDADLQCTAILLPELFVVLAVLFELFAQCLEDVLLQCAADRLQLTALLQQLTRNVQREIGRVHEPLDKAQIVRQEILALVHDEDMARVELDARLIVRLIEIERCAGRDLEERRILHRALRLRVENLHRSFPLVELIAEEIVVLLGFDLRLRTRPERLH